MAERELGILEKAVAGHIQRANGEGPPGVRISYPLLAICVALIGPGGSALTAVITRDLGPVEKNLAVLALRVETMNNSITSLRLDMQTQLSARDVSLRDSLDKMSKRLEEAEGTSRRNSILIERLAAKSGVDTGR